MREKSGSGLGRMASVAALMLAAVVGVGFVMPVTASLADEGVAIPAPAVDEAAKSGTETAILAGGCFWGVQGVFQHVNGVVSATSGYAGGDAATASYDTVSTGSTGHAESVQIVYDPSKVTYGHLLQIYFSVVHNPTELNRQGPDSGTQYRSAIFPTTAEQANIAKAYIAQLGGAAVFGAPIVTKIESGATFYKAEDYHQDFLMLNPSYPYIVANDLPKVADLKSYFPADYKDKPVLVMN
ncbi:MAG: peptide-methionine (S)-S-oxide reductase MsrA [Paracoccaceae bacterium]